MTDQGSLYSWHQADLHAPSCRHSIFPEFPCCRMVTTIICGPCKEGDRLHLSMSD